MIQLSIIIPASRIVSDSRDFEQTLVSVLENRPAQCEILVACDATYEDPYDLSDEVRLIRGASNPAWTTHANRGLSQARGKIVSVLLPPVTVEDAWHCDASEFLTHSPVDVVGVSPQIHYADPATPASGGVILAEDGQRCALDVAAIDQADMETTYGTFGVDAQAGFFRRAELVQAGGWNEAICPELADVELNLRLRSLGYAFEFCPNSHVVGVAHLPQSSYRITRDLQRLYRTYRAKQVVPRRGLSARIGGLMKGSILGNLAGRVGRLPMHGVESVTAWNLDMPSGLEPSRSDTGSERSRAA